MERERDIGRVERERDIGRWRGSGVERERYREVERDIGRWRGREI